jgi:uncharacterized protein involved in response to NO
MSTAARRGAYSGPALLSFGFRPFFLLAGAWPALIVPLWVMAYLGQAPFAGALTRDWHVHEMLFGYLSGVMAGFLLTAVPNWTGRPPVRGWPLAALAGLWIAGRVAMVVGPQAKAAAVVDSAFLVVFAGVVWREVLVGRNWKNLAVCALISLLALANIGVHLRPLQPDLAAGAERLALGVAAMMIALIGGRVTPSFTRNWLVQRGVARLPAPASRFDLAALGVTGLALLAWVTVPTQAPAGMALMAAGLANVVRLARWRGTSTLSEPLVWSLHKGFGWLAFALLIMGAAVLWPSAVPPSAGIHALAVGAIGIMTLAIMTRAILGHTGRALRAGRATLAIYVFACLAPLLRLAAALLPEHQALWLGLSATVWSLAFGGFVIVYGPMLIAPRVDLPSPADGLPPVSPSVTAPSSRPPAGAAVPRSAPRSGRR